MYATLYKTTSDVNSLHIYIYKHIILYIGITFAGPIAAQRLVHFPDTREPSLHKWFITVLTVPRIHIYIIL